LQIIYLQRFDFFAKKGADFSAKLNAWLLGRCSITILGETEN
jgi:hypothetical protein